MRLMGGRTLVVGAVLWGLVSGAPGGGPGEAAGGEADFVGLTPCRLVDTRGNGFVDPFGPPALGTGVPRDFPLQGQCGIPTTATAVSLNVTATNTQGPGFLLLYPQGGAQPLVSTLNYVAGETVANAALVPLGAGGLTVVAGVSGTDLILDVNGYFTDLLVREIGDNLAVGRTALLVNATGVHNTAIGSDALDSNTDGNSNTALGFRALGSNVTGSFNTALGQGALAENTTGGANVAIGNNALRRATGFNNVAIGFNTGPAVGPIPSGNHNIYIGSNVGEAADSETIRIGSNSTHTHAFIGGVRGRTTDNADAIAVLVDSQGQLGTTSSSRRVKTDVEAVGERSRALHALRPVSFRYRVHAPDSPVQYGLIAEEVAEVYPELVVRDAEGAPETVRYHLLPALLLSELQRQERVLAEKDRQVAELVAAVADLTARLTRLEGRGPLP